MFCAIATVIANPYMVLFGGTRFQQRANFSKGQKLDLHDMEVDYMLYQP